MKIMIGAMAGLFVIASLNNIVLSNIALSDDKFPLRKSFPTLKTIETAELTKIYDTAHIVDVRATFEYDVLHMTRAKNIPVTNMAFFDGIAKVRPKQDATPMVFYCNGITCPKSYEACDIASKAGFANIFVYDSGIFEWAKTHPDKAQFFGQAPADASKFISKAKFEEKMKSWDAFKAGAPEAFFVDIREPKEKAGASVPEDLKDVRSIPFDNLIKSLQGGNMKDKTLFVMDSVGKQVEWLQYYLIKFGYSNYFFLKGGVKGLKK